MTTQPSAKGDVNRPCHKLAPSLRPSKGAWPQGRHVGDTVDFEVLDDISVNGTLVIPKGALAFATVTEAQAKRRMARGGKLDINIDYGVHPQRQDVFRLRAGSN